MSLAVGILEWTTAFHRPTSESTDLKDASIGIVVCVYRPLDRAKILSLSSAKVDAARFVFDKSSRLASGIDIVSAPGVSRRYRKGTQIVISWLSCRLGQTTQNLAGFPAFCSTLGPKDGGSEPSLL